MKKRLWRIMMVLAICIVIIVLLGAYALTFFGRPYLTLWWGGEHYMVFPYLSPADDPDIVAKQPVFGSVEEMRKAVQIADFSLPEITHLRRFHATNGYLKTISLKYMYEPQLPKGWRIGESCLFCGAYYEVSFKDDNDNDPNCYTMRIRPGSEYSNIRKKILSIQGMTYETISTEVEEDRNATVFRCYRYDTAKRYYEIVVYAVKTEDGESCVREFYDLGYSPDWGAYKDAERFSSAFRKIEIAGIDKDNYFWIEMESESFEKRPSLEQIASFGLEN